MRMFNHDPKQLHYWLYTYCENQLPDFEIEQLVQYIHILNILLHKLRLKQTHQNNIQNIPIII